MKIEALTQSFKLLASNSLSVTSAMSMPASEVAQSKILDLYCALANGRSAAIALRFPNTVGVESWR
jgi:hypothetical protein